MSQDSPSFLSTVSPLTCRGLVVVCPVDPMVLMMKRGEGLVGADRSEPGIFLRSVRHILLRACPTCGAAERKK